MRKLGQLGLLTALVVVLNLFCLLKCAHPGHPAAHHTSHNTLPHSQQRGSSRSRISATGQASSDHAEVSLTPKLKPIVDLSAHLALPSNSLQIFAPEFVSAPLAEQPVLSLGSAARAPGAPRGPPSIS